MPTITQYTDPYRALLRQPPVPGPGVCAVCHSGTGYGFTICNSCDVTTRQVTRPTRQVLPISLYQVSEQYWHMLRNYKDGTHVARRQFGTIVAAIIARFTAAHWRCTSRMLGGEATIVTTVPSTRPAGRSGEHPLVTAVTRGPQLRPLYRQTLVRGEGVVAHRQASDDAFVVTDHVSGQRVLLIEDTFTTGARTQSAASALQMAGAAVAVVTAGRVITPDWNDNCRRIWEVASDSTFTFDACGRCRA